MDGNTFTDNISPYVSPQFIKVYENIIPHSLCDDLIQKFESNQDQWETRNKLYSERNLSFKELHFNKYWDTWKKDQENIINILMKQVKVYMSDFSKFCFPVNVGLEPFKMKKYEPNDIDEFGWHVDVNSRRNMERFLAFFLYLSDNEEGKTEFPYQNITTDCVKGSMVIFPPAWPWYHRGTKPIKVPKYFLGGYLTYVD